MAAYRFLKPLFASCLFWVPLLAQADVTLNLMTWVGYSPDAQVAEFEKEMSAKYGETVKVKIHYINGYEEGFTLVRNGEADVITLVSHILNDARFQFISNKLILPLDINKLPNYQFVMENYKGPVEHEGTVYATPIASGPYGLAYNKKYFDKPPMTWDVLWDPQYAGKYAITNGIFEVNLYITALSLGYTPESFGDFKQLNNPEFQAKLRSLVENAESLWPGIDEAYHLQGLHLAASWGFSIPGLQALGEDWAMAEPLEGSPAWIDVNVIRESLKNDELKLALAYEWIDYTLSPEFQLDVIVEGIATPPVTTNAVARLSEEQMTAFHLNDPDFIDKFRIYYPTIESERVRNGNTLLWEAANKGLNKPVRTPPQ